MYLYLYMCIYEEIHYKELARIVLEAEKSCDLLSANWRLESQWGNF